MVNEVKLTLEQKLQARADKLKDDLQKAKNRLQMIKSKNSTAERKKRTSKLCDTASIFYMISPELIETKANTDLYRQVVGLAISLNEMRSNLNDENKQKLAALETSAKQYLAQKESNPA